MVDPYQTGIAPICDERHSLAEALYSPLANPSDLDACAAAMPICVGRAGSLEVAVMANRFGGPLRVSLGRLCQAIRDAAAVADQWNRSAERGEQEDAVTSEFKSALIAIHAPWNEFTKELMALQPSATL
jgi:hypothetical protein